MDFFARVAEKVVGRVPMLRPRPVSLLADRGALVDASPILDTVPDAAEPAARAAGQESTWRPRPAPAGPGPVPRAADDRVAPPLESRPAPRLSAKSPVPEGGDQEVSEAPLIALRHAPIPLRGSPPTQRETDQSAIPAPPVARASAPARGTPPASASSADGPRPAGPRPLGAPAASQPPAPRRSLDRSLDASMGSSRRATSAGRDDTPDAPRPSRVWAEPEANHESAPLLAVHGPPPALVLSLRPAEPAWPEPAAPAVPEPAAPPVVEVTIGRVDVRAIVPPRPERPVSPKANRLTLDEYLKRPPGATA